MKREVDSSNRYKNIFIIFGIVLFVIVASGSIYYFRHIPRCTDLKGDANGDGRIDENDITHINGYFRGEGLNCRENADVNEDGVVDILDGREFVAYLAFDESFSPAGGSGSGQGAGEASDESSEANEVIDDSSRDVEDSTEEDRLEQYRGSEIVCENNPISQCDDNLDCTSGVECDCSQECKTDWCWGSSERTYVCQISCATAGSYAPNSRDCCQGLKYLGGLCVLPKTRIDCNNNPPGDDSSELSCDLGYKCDSPGECASNLCSSGVCIPESVGGGGGTSSSGSESPSSPAPPPDSGSGSGSGGGAGGSPSASGSPSGSGSPISFSPAGEKPFYQRLVGWLTKTITGWFTSEIVLIKV